MTRGTVSALWAWLCSVGARASHEPSGSRSRCPHVQCLVRPYFRVTNATFKPCPHTVGEPRVSLGPLGLSVIPFLRVHAPNLDNYQNPLGEGDPGLQTIAPVGLKVTEPVGNSIWEAVPSCLLDFYLIFPPQSQGHCSSHPRA